jgi:hypothetical protein
MLTDLERHTSTNYMSTQRLDGVMMVLTYPEIVYLEAQSMSHLVIYEVEDNTEQQPHL